MINSEEITKDFLTLARLALTGRPQDVQLLLHKTSKKFNSTEPDFSKKLSTLLSESPTRATPLRKNITIPIPVDIDSRLQLLRLENFEIDEEPLYTEGIKRSLNQLLMERQNTTVLMKHGLFPTKSLLLHGPPGVGKTLMAKWIATKLNKPLLVLDLAAVMSSYLGRTGNNIRFVLDYAKNIDCVLLLDEIDAIAKKRDDNSEIGELKRLVTVLLQEIDEWPASGLLIAATNHPKLLDPALWRRFDMTIDFDLPTVDLLEKYLKQQFKNENIDISKWSKILAYVLQGKSINDAERTIKSAKKATILSNVKIEDAFIEIIRSANLLTSNQKKELATMLVTNEVCTQRDASDITGISRTTIRKHTKSNEDNE
jgi:SpoVK/Ycf46/Vps4 family AAA+-type ATPase